MRQFNMPQTGCAECKRQGDFVRAENLCPACREKLIEAAKQILLDANPKNERLVDRIKDE